MQQCCLLSVLAAEDIVRLIAKPDPSAFLNDLHYLLERDKWHHCAPLLLYSVYF